MHLLARKSYTLIFLGLPLTALGTARLGRGIVSLCNVSTFISVSCIKLLPRSCIDDEIGVLRQVFSHTS